MKNTLLAIVFLPLIASMLAGFAGKKLGRTWTHRVVIALVFASALLSVQVLLHFVGEPSAFYEYTLYHWAQSGGIQFQVGFWLDSLTALMMVVVTSVSLMVHIYTIGYMKNDPGYQRFFSYIALFTFAMLMLVTSNNFLQLFFGWEAVGLVSYLLIGFWYKKPTAIFANLKAFLVNRVGDLGFLLGIAGVLLYFDSLDYGAVFAAVDTVATANPTTSLLGNDVSVMTMICILLFIGAMGKSAQVPLHVWLPDSMEGPTPISALIHAATMVTAGVFMVARMSPLFEYSEAALSFVLFIGATTALFMGLLGLVQQDIKRVVAYSTLSQLGYMVVALGASAYQAAVFHLMTHAFFKALLFLAAGSVIIALHHQQDMRHMGNLKKYLPITYVTSLIGTLALIGFPGFAGFYSKDAIIEAVHASSIAFSGYAYFAVLAGVVITALYSFRMFFLVFHTDERVRDEDRAHLHEPSWVVWLPLVLLAIPSVMIAWFTAEPVLIGEFLKGAITVHDSHHPMTHFKEAFHGPLDFALHAVQTKPFWLMLTGVVLAWFFYIYKPELRTNIKEKLEKPRAILENKYGFDAFNERYLAGGARAVGQRLWDWCDAMVIDSTIVNGSANGIGRLAAWVRQVQTGYVYHYVLAMVLGVVIILGMVVWG